MSEMGTGGTAAVAYEDLQIVAAIAALRLPPGAGEADRAARVRTLLDTSGDLSYAISTYTHRLLVYSGRRPASGGLGDDTIALQDALEGFAREVRAIADAYRSMITPPAIDAQAPRVAGG
jgi:hypothetical protein